MNRYMSMIRERSAAPLRWIFAVPVAVLLIWQPMPADARGAPEQTSGSLTFSKYRVGEVWELWEEYLASRATHLNSIRLKI